MRTGAKATWTCVVRALRPGDATLSVRWPAELDRTHRVEQIRLLTDQFGLTDRLGETAILLRPQYEVPSLDDFIGQVLEGVRQAVGNIDAVSPSRRRSAALHATQPQPALAAGAFARFFLGLVLADLGTMMQNLRQQAERLGNDRLLPRVGGQAHGQTVMANVATMGALTDLSHALGSSADWISRAVRRASPRSMPP